MFWGLALETGKRYAKTVETPFRITQAVLDTTTADDDIVRVMVDVDDCETLLCNLSIKHGILQCPLDLQFLDGEQIALYSYGGKGQVYLSGYLISDEGEESMFGDEEEDIAEEEEVSSDEDVPELVAPSTSGKRKPDSIANPIPVKKSKVHQDVEIVQPTKVTVCDENGVKGLEDDDEDEDDEDYEIEGEEGSDEGEEEEESDDEDMEDEEELEEEEDGDEEMEDDANKTPKAEVKTPKAEVKTPKAEVKTPKAEVKTPKAEVKTPKAEAKTPKAEAKTPKAEAKTPKAEIKTEIEEKKDNTETEEKSGSELDNSLSENKTPKKEKKKKKKELLAMNGETPQTPKQKIEEKQKQDDAPKTPKQKNIISDKTPGKLDKTPKSQVKVEAAVASPIVSKAGGVLCEDLVVGAGQEAKNGRMVSVYYEGRLKSNNKMFDATLKGPPFKFRLGSGEVIKGWDVGVNGMKVGGKRRVVCPPHMAYGKRGAPPDIPKNATLTFTIELKGV